MLVFILIFTSVTIIHAKSIIQVNDEYAIQTYVNSSYISLPIFQFRKTNRTHKALNMTFLLNENISEGNDLQINLAFKISLSNVFRSTPHMFSMYACKLIKSRKFHEESVSLKTNLKSCPLEKGVEYFINNISPTSENWWPNFPTGRYLVVMKFLLHNVLILELNWVSEILSI